ncbi:MAG: helix-turn-helix transcriptional regulator [Ignavibacteria bacterium]|nr:helix-turn-helix transcriptional regulator [Ignavibacteria bacterium]
MVSEYQILNIFAENIRYYRKLQNISQEELGFRAGLHRTYIGMIERCERTVTILSLEKIAKALGVGYDDLLTERK